jgi:hypothetical protein
VAGVAVLAERQPSATYEPPGAAGAGGTGATTRGVRPGLLGLLLIGTPYTGILFCVAADLQVRHGSTAGVAGFALLPLAIGSASAG